MLYLVPRRTVYPADSMSLEQLATVRQWAVVDLNDATLELTMQERIDRHAAILRYRYAVSAAKLRGSV